MSHPNPQELGQQVEQTAHDVAARYEHNPHARLGATIGCYQFHYQMLFSDYLSTRDQLDRLQARLAEAELRLQELEIEAGTL